MKKWDRDTGKAVRWAIEKYHTIRSDEWIAERLGVSRVSVQRMRQRMGLKKSDGLSALIQNDQNTRRARSTPFKLKSIKQKMRRGSELTDDEWRIFDASVKEKLLNAVCK